MGKAPEFNRLCGEQFSAFVNVDTLSSTTPTTSWTIICVACDGRDPGMPDPLICPVPTPVTIQPHNLPCPDCCQWKGGTGLLIGHGWLPEAACSCWNECVSGFSVVPQETVSCPGCELGLNAPDGPAAPGRKGPCLAARDKRRQDTEHFLYMLPVLDARGSDCDWAQCRTVQYTQSTFPVAQLRQTFADRISTNISQCRLS